MGHGTPVMELRGPTARRLLVEAEADVYRLRAVVDILYEESRKREARIVKLSEQLQAEREVTVTLSAERNDGFCALMDMVAGLTEEMAFAANVLSREVK